jgi:hypothetical protein
MLGLFRLSQEADGMNQYDYSGYQFGSVVCVEWSMEFCGSESRRRVHSAFPTAPAPEWHCYCSKARQSDDSERAGRQGDQMTVLGNEC